MQTFNLLQTSPCGKFATAYTTPENPEALETKTHWIDADGNWHIEVLYFWIVEFDEFGFAYPLDFFHTCEEAMLDIWTIYEDDEDKDEEVQIIEAKSTDLFAQFKQLLTLGLMG